VIVAVRLRPLDRADLPAVLALQHAQAAPGARWSEATLAAQLLDPDHAGGAHVRVADDGGEIAGVIGWIAGGDGEYFGAPLLARDPATAAVLVDDVVARARAAGAAWIRIGCGGDGDPRRAALVERGFAVALQFLTYTCAAARRAAAIPAELVRVPLAEVAPAVLQALHDATFASVDNSLPISPGEVRHLQARAWPDASGVWMDGARAAAFLVLLRERAPADHVVIDAIGVGDAWRRRGIGRALVDHAIDAAARDGAREVRALIASTNRASRALHEAAGLRVASTRDVLELRL
jgi:ribosomal protein S18 acetylase RimI-like enzyme